MFRLPGDKRRLSANEINRWNTLSARDQLGLLKRQGQNVPNINSYDPNSRIVYAQNTSGSDRQRFDTMAIDATDCLLWDLNAAGEFDVVFKLTTADPELAPAILIDPIENNGYGRAVIYGPAIAKVETADSADFRFANGQASSHSLLAAPAGPIQLLAAPSASAAVYLPVIIHAGPGLASIVCGLINTTFSGRPSTFTVKTFYGINGTTPTGATLTVANRFNWDAGTADDPVCIIWDPDQAEWFPLQMECPA